MQIQAEQTLSQYYEWKQYYYSRFVNCPISGGSIVIWLLSQISDLEQRLQILWMKTIVPRQLCQFPYFGWHHCNTIFGKTQTARTMSKTSIKKYNLLVQILKKPKFFRNLRQVVAHRARSCNERHHKPRYSHNFTSWWQLCLEHHAGDAKPRHPPILHSLNILRRPGTDNDQTNISLDKTITHHSFEEVRYLPFTDQHCLRWHARLWRHQRSPRVAGKTKTRATVRIRALYHYHPPHHTRGYTRTTRHCHSRTNNPLTSP